MTTPAGLPGAQAVESAGQGELGSAEALDEVAPAHPAGVLEGGQDGVEAGEAAGEALGEDGLAAQHPVAGEQLLGSGGGGRGGGGGAASRSAQPGTTGRCPAGGAAEGRGARPGPPGGPCP